VGLVTEIYAVSPSGDYHQVKKKMVRFHDVAWNLNSTTLLELMSMKDSFEYSETAGLGKTG
jgi:hypothetical protein